MPEGSSPAVELTYMGLCTLCIGTMSYAFICATLTTSLAPAMALKGKDGSSMRRAVELMKRDRGSIMLAFSIGSCAFNAVMVAMIWIKLEWLGSQVMCTTIFVICSAWCFTSARRTVNQYTSDSDSSIPGARVVTGKEFLRKADGTDERTLSQLARASVRLRKISAGAMSPMRRRARSGDCPYEQVSATRAVAAPAAVPPATAAPSAAPETATPNLVNARELVAELRRPSTLGKGRCRS